MSTETILVVDDDKLNQSLLSISLANHGYEVEIADDGRQALELLQDHTFGVILLDLLMPHVDGYEVLTYMQTENLLVDIPVIIISAMGEIDDVVRGIEMGAIDYLTKPFEPQILFSKVKVALELQAQKRELKQLASQLKTRNDLLEAEVHQRKQIETRLQENLSRTETFRLHLETNIMIGQHITSILDLETLLHKVTELIIEQLEYEYAAIFITDPNHIYLELQAETSLNGHKARQRRWHLDDKVVLTEVVHEQKAILGILEEQFLRVTPDMQSQLVIPLIIGQIVMGVIDIQSHKAAAFAPTDITIMQLLANQVAIALRNATLYQQGQVRRKLAEVLQKMTLELPDTFGTNAVFNLILSTLNSIVPYDRIAWMLRYDQEFGLETIAAYGYPDNYQAISRQVAHEDVVQNPIFMRIFETQKPVFIADTLTDENWISYPSDLPAPRSWLGIPFIRDEEVVGVLSIVRITNDDLFNSEDAELATAFMNQATVALENARLYDEIARSNQELEYEVHQRTQALQQITRLDQAKSDFIAVISHELRTPLTIMKGYSQMLLKDQTIQANNVHHDMVNGIYTGSVRLHEIINSLLDVAKIDNKTLQLHLDDIDIAVLIENVANTFTDDLIDRQQKLIIDDLTPLPRLKADKDALYKVFYHLIVNAIKYTPDGGTVRISGRFLTKEEVRLPYPSGGIELTVSDTGIGISPKDQELIFAKFFQTGQVALHSSGKTKFKGGGPGLGLGIVKGIVEAHGGRIRVESPGHNEETCPGSKFHVLLPIIKK
ncbi:MAG TPA: GAF domain-containing protein [Anaerolineae bacterium]|nr:GAF domain-containing protein [Anaerolineae bacterium]